MSVAVNAEVAVGRWEKLSLVEQLANIGSEVGRAAHAKATGNEARLAKALDRCLDLFDLTLADDRWRGRRREIARAREIVCDFLVGENAHGSTVESLESYFLPFAVAARRARGSFGNQDMGQAQARADRAMIRRLIAMTDAERESYFLASNRNILQLLADAK